MDDLLKEFLTETLESLAVLDAEIVRLEQTPNDPELINGIFRVLHTIKGTCGFLSLPRLEAVAHAGESVLSRLRNGQLTADGTIVTLILSCLDRIRFLLDALASAGKEPEGDNQDLIQQLEALTVEPAPLGPAEAGDDDQPPAELAPAAPEAAGGLRETAAAPAEQARQAIRVKLTVIDRLMDLVSELVLTRNQLMRLSNGQADSEFDGPLQRLNQLVSDLQDGVMKTRMQPIGEAWSSLPRLVRDLAKELGKEITLVQSGAETELDRQVLELVRAPLTHMVRNAADHGLEAPEARQAAGKPRAGTIEINAYHRDGYVMVELSDDGRGLSVDRIRRKALAVGLASESQLAAMSDQRAARFIFHPGFSTTEHVNAISGRGVGMDVVLSNIERIGGSVDFQSEPGRGTRFLVRIPLTMAVVPALLVESAGQVFALPQSAVAELVQLDATGQADLSWTHGTWALERHGCSLPLVDLRRFLHLAAEGEDGAGPDDAPLGHVAVLQVGAQRFGLLLDRVHDAEEIVIKPVAPILRHLRFYAGNTILGDGQVAMILEPDAIAVEAGIPVFAEVAGPVAGSAATPAPAETESFLLLQAGDRRNALPLSLVTRLEQVDLAALEPAEGRYLLKYHGGLLPVIALDRATALPLRGFRPVAVLTGDGRSVGLLADRIIDIVEQPLERRGSEPSDGIGSAVIDGQATQILDGGYFLQQAAVTSARTRGTA